MFKKSLFLLFLTILFLSFTQAASESHVIRVYEINRDDLGDYVSIEEVVQTLEGTNYVTVCDKIREGETCNIGMALIKINNIERDDPQKRSVVIAANNEGTAFDIIYEKGTGNYITLKAQEDLPLEKASFVVRKPNGSPIEKFTYAWENGEVVLIESERYRPDEHQFKFVSYAWSNSFYANTSGRTTNAFVEGLVGTEVSIENMNFGFGTSWEYMPLVGGYGYSAMPAFYYPGPDSDERLAVSHTDLLDYRQLVEGKSFDEFAIISWKGPTDQHTACVNKQCVIVEGVGENECRIDRDCKLSKGNTPGTPGIMFSPPAEGAECNWFQKIFFKSRC